MKRFISLVTAALLAALCLTACGKPNNGASDGSDAAIPIATREPAATLEVGELVVPTKAPKATEKAQDTTAQETTAAATQPTTRPAVSNTIPPDDVNSRNLNPNLSSIIGVVADEIRNATLKLVKLEPNELTLNVGESAELEVVYTPADAAIKTCTVKSDHTKIADAALDGGTVTVTAVKEGSCTITLESYNGATAHCAVKVTKQEEVVTTEEQETTREKLITQENADIWLGEITAVCEALGMKKDESLESSDITFNTADESSELTFDEYNDMLIAQITSQLEDATAGNYSVFAFNTSAVKNGEDYTFTVSLKRVEEDGEITPEA